MTPASVRLSPYVKSLWRAVDEAERHAIERSIPDGHFISVIYRGGLHDLTVRLYREVPDPDDIWSRTYPELVAMRDHQRDIAEGCWRVLLDAGVAVMA